jgi:RNA polymerase sigma factor (sigma-70 family)
MDLSYEVYSKCDRCREGKMTEYTNLCFYHRKIEDGLIDEPEYEVGYVDVPVENPEMVVIFIEQLDMLANLMCPDEWKEDAKQYASMGYQKLLSDWNQESSWKTYINSAIKLRMIDYMRKEGLHKERMQNLGGYEDTLEDPLDLEDMYAQKEIYDRLYDTAHEVSADLSDLEMRILWHRLLTFDPISQNAIAEIEGVSQQAVSKAEDRIINRLREAFNEI